MTFIIDITLQIYSSVPYNFLTMKKQIHFEYTYNYVQELMHFY